MKNKKIWLGMLAMVLVLGMTVVGCKPEELWFGAVVLDNPYPCVGERITASFSYEDSLYKPDGLSSWKWYKTKEDASFLSDVKNKTSIGSDGDTLRSSYTVSQSDAGFWIWAEVSYSGNSGSESSRTRSTVMGVPSTATVSVSMRASYFSSGICRRAGI